METLKFFRCNTCGNVFVKAVNGFGTVTCCNEKMEELTPQKTDGLGEKHLPVVKREGNKVTVTVSSVIHPSTDAHHIEFIVIQTTNGFQFRKLKSGDLPQTTFVIDEEDRLVAAYEYCNLHGLWMTEFSNLCEQVYF
ncbi:MAG: desulfoferrodoxin [Paludibacteraceae bacterium]|nr:desulfoferrodoxin [Paludibacteraceae bacterium]